MSILKTNPPLYILAGGRSSRFGSNKARHEVAGVPLLRRVANGFKPVVSMTFAVATTAEEYENLGIPTVADIMPHQGPLGGLATALRHRLDTQGAGWVALCSCDFLDPDPAWLDPLLDVVRRSVASSAVCYRGERWEPLLGLYHSRVLPFAEHHLATGRGAMWRLLEAVEATGIALPPGYSSLPQANTPAALHRFQAEVEVALC